MVSIPYGRVARPCVNLTPVYILTCAVFKSISLNLLKIDIFLLLREICG